MVSTINNASPHPSFNTSNFELPIFGIFFVLFAFVEFGGEKGGRKEGRKFVELGSMTRQPVLQTIPANPMTIVSARCSSKITWSTIPPKWMVVRVRVRVRVLVVLMVVRWLKIVVEVCVIHTHIMLIHVLMVVAVVVEVRIRMMLMMIMHVVVVVIEVRIHMMVMMVVHMVVVLIEVSTHMIMMVIHVHGMRCGVVMIVVMQMHGLKAFAAVPTKLAQPRSKRMKQDQSQHFVKRAKK
eukprot:scaffold31020_cov160-Skeletonema_menzelii.AAC.2